MHTWNKFKLWPTGSCHFILVTFYTCRIYKSSWKVCTSENALWDLFSNSKWDRTQRLLLSISVGYLIFLEEDKKSFINISFCIYRQTNNRGPKLAMVGTFWDWGNRKMLKRLSRGAFGRYERGYFKMYHCGSLKPFLKVTKLFPDSRSKKFQINTFP